MWIYILAGVIIAAIAWTDAATHTIPDYMIALLLLCGLLHGIWEKELLKGLLGLVICGLPILFLAVDLQQKIGGGDIKLCAAIGALLGPLNGSLVILEAVIGLSLWGLLGRKATKPIPYGPFVFPAYVAVIFLQEGMI